MDGDALAELAALREEAKRLEAELARLRRQTPWWEEPRRGAFDRAAHEALRQRLAAHREKILAWRRKHLRPGDAPTPPPAG